ncbi:hypothetical protein JW935_05995 [candidate division KSB1 bacterium]|nr:hypothetical protein [candidate division KSB1 bacterium]
MSHKEPSRPMRLVDKYLFYDNFVRQLSPEAKLLWFFLINNNETANNYSGAFFLLHSTISEMTGLTYEQIDNALKQIPKSKLIYQKDVNFFYLANFVRWNVHNYSVMTNAINSLRKLGVKKSFFEFWVDYNSTVFQKLNYPLPKFEIDDREKYLSNFDIEPIEIHSVQESESDCVADSQLDCVPDPPTHPPTHPGGQINKLINKESLSKESKTPIREKERESKQKRAKKNETRDKKAEKI